MSDLKLLPPDPPTALERLLLDAAANEAPSAEQRLRVRQALGLPAAVVVPTAQAGRSAVLVKAVIAGAVVVGAALLFVLSGLGRKAPAPVAPVVAQIATNPLPVLALAPSLPVVEAAPMAAPSAKPAAKSAVSVAQPSAASGADLSEQLRLIDTARSAVAAGDAAAASRALSSYASQFPHGTFGQEAAVLRIETTDLQGNHAQAAALARSFLARHPNSPHVGLVQSIAGRAQ